MPTITHIAGPFTYSGIPSSILDSTIKGLSAEIPIEGPQVILRWTKPLLYTAITSMKIVRKMGSFPLSETDGKVVLTTSDISLETFTDFPTMAPEYYYYKIFTQLAGSWYSTTLAEIVALALDTKSENQDKLFQEMPDVFKAFDRARMGSTELAIAPAQNIDAYEKCALGEDGVTPQGSFRRFLKLLNIGFNDGLSFIRAIATRDGMEIVHDINRTCPKYLAYIAKLWGWKFNFDIPVNAARAELISLPDIYSKKGRKDVTEALINGIFSGHTVTLIAPDEVVDFNGYPTSSFLDTLSLPDEVNFLTSSNSLWVLADLTNDSTIGFNKVAINIIPTASLKVKPSQILKCQDIGDDFYSILDDVFIIIHETFNVSFPGDFTTLGVAFINTFAPFPNPAVLTAFERLAVGEGAAEWDYSSPPLPAVGDINLRSEKYRELHRNKVFLTPGDIPTLTPTKKILVRDVMDLNTFTSLNCREAGLFGNGSTAIKDTGTLLCEKFFPIRFANSRVRLIVDFKITLP